MFRQWYGWPALPTLLLAMLSTLFICKTHSAPTAYDKAKAAEHLAICLNQKDRTLKPKSAAASKTRNLAFCNIESSVAKQILSCLANRLPKTSEDQRKELLTNILKKICPDVEGAEQTAKMSLDDITVKWDHLRTAFWASDGKLPNWLFLDAGFPEKFEETFGWSNYKASTKGTVDGEMHHRVSCIGWSNAWVAVCIVMNKASGEEEVLYVGVKGIFGKDKELFRMLKPSKLPFMSHVISTGSNKNGAMESGKTGNSENGLEYYTVPLWGKNVETRLQKRLLRPNNFKALLKKLLEQIRQMHSAGLAHGQLEDWNIAVNSKTPRALGFYGFGLALPVTRDDAGGMAAFQDYENVIKMLEKYGLASVVPRVDAAADSETETAGLPPHASFALDVYEPRTAVVIRSNIIDPIREKLRVLLQNDYNMYNDVKKPEKENRFKQARMFALFDQLHYGIVAALGLDEFDPENKTCLYTEPNSKKREEAETAGTKCVDVPETQPVTPVKAGKPISVTDDSPVPNAAANEKE